MAEAIARLAVRGAPALGIAAALALGVEARAARAVGQSPDQTLDRLRAAGRELASARPTAVNLPWGVGRTLRAAEEALDRAGSTADIAEAVSQEAETIWEEDRAASRAMAAHGAALLPGVRKLLTHCHTGGLATGGGGTALGIILEVERRSANGVEVWATETRPLLQGARLTAWELTRAGVGVRLIADSAAAHVIARNGIEAVLVGADRIARNGDVANKIGTYPLALAAREARIPFLVAAPTSTIDARLPDGASIPIEERDPAEVTALRGFRTSPLGVTAYNPAFDVTPAALVTYLVTEQGVLHPPLGSPAAVDNRV